MAVLMLQPGSRSLQHWPLFGAHTSPAYSGQQQQQKKTVVEQLYAHHLLFPKYIFMKIDFRFLSCRLLAFHSHLLLADLCCLPNNFHGYQSFVIMNGSNSCVLWQISTCKGENYLFVLLSFFKENFEGLLVSKK